MRELERMLAGEMYNPGDSELRALREHAHNEAERFNRLGGGEEGIEILRKLFGKTGKSFVIEPTFRCDYGFNIHVGDNFSANFDCIILDVCRVDIGDNCMMGPRACLYTATHPLNVAERYSGRELGRPVVIGHNVWVGGNAVILPGVSIGDNAVVAAGAVVTKDVPPNTVVAGNPARVIKNV